MSKSKEELNELKKRYEDFNEKCRELTPEELKEVSGGIPIPEGILLSIYVQSLIGADGKPLKNKSSNPLQEVVKQDQDNPSC